MSGWVAILAAVVVGTWNGNWLPSGRAEHRANAAVEDATISASAKMLAWGLSAMDPQATNEVILCVNEVRGPKVASNLVARIGRPGLRLAAVSGYRRRDRFDQQQDIIATTLPVIESGWRKWTDAGEETPPRGYAYAVVVVTPAVTTIVYAVHLKSNYGSSDGVMASLNRAKRTRAIAELLERLPKDRSAIILGDFNADPWRKQFADEQIFKMTKSAGFTDLLARLPRRKRGTYPHKRYGDSALDHILVRGFEAAGTGKIINSELLSDHWAFYDTILPLRSEQ